MTRILVAGLRRGEIIGLEQGDVDQRARRLSVFADRGLCREDGSPWTWEVVRAGIARASRRAGLREIQELAGHTDLKDDQRYMHPAPRVLEARTARAVAKLWQRAERRR